ncbi:MAG: hypothetical protein AABW72_03745 [archaeon]
MGKNSRRKAERRKQPERKVPQEVARRVSLLNQEVQRLTAELPVLQRRVAQAQEILRLKAKRPEGPSKVDFGEFITANIRFYTAAVRQMEAGDKLFALHQQYGGHVGLSQFTEHNQQMIESRRSILSLFQGLHMSFDNSDYNVFLTKLNQTLPVITGLMRNPNQLVH